MALVGTRIDTRTLAAIAAAGSSSFAHGLPASPTFVIVQENTTTNSTSGLALAIKWDDTNVSIYNHGNRASATLYSSAIAAHSVIQ